jgi:hypothetical protein
MAIRSTRTIELPKNAGKTDDEIRTQHQRRKYGDDQYRIKKLGGFNFNRSIKFVSKRGLRINNGKFVCWGCDLLFTQGFAYLTQVGTVYFCHKCKAQAVPFATVDIGQIALQGGKADSGR